MLAKSKPTISAAMIQIEIVSAERVIPKKTALSAPPVASIESSL